MLVTIQLPASKDRVTVREIPALIATALHPDIAEGTPYQITRLMKMPTTADNAANWCGAGCRPFQVSMSDEDMAELAAGVWASLPPLSLPVSEPEWQPYAEAMQANPPTGWQLVAWNSGSPHFNAAMERSIAEDEWRETVRKAAVHGHLTPRHPKTLLPQPQAAGEWLLDCFVTVADLTQFLARLDIGVTQENGPAEKDCFIPLSSAATYLANKQWGDDASEESALAALNHRGANPGCLTPIMAVRSLVELEHQGNIDALEHSNALKLYSPTSHVPTIEKAGALVRESEIVELLMAGAHLQGKAASELNVDTVSWTPERRNQLRAEHSALKAKGHKAPTKELAIKHGISEQRIRELKAEATTNPERNKSVIPDWFNLSPKGKAE